MNLDDLKKNVSILSLAKQRYEVRKVGSVHRIKPCPICGSSQGFTIYPDTNSYSCYGANCTLKGGSVYDYLMEVEGMNPKEAREKLEMLGGDPIKQEGPIDSTQANAKEPIEQAKDYTSLIIELYNNQSEEDKLYFINRGMTEEIIQKYMLVVGDIKKLAPKYYGKRAIIPIWRGNEVVFWNSRALKDSDIKYLKPTGKSTYLNIDYLEKTAKGDVIVVCEGEFDALSLEAIGVKAIGIGGVSNFDNLKKMVKRNDVFLLTGFDNDCDFTKINKKFQLKIPGKYKDLNEWFVADKEGFESSIKAQIALITSSKPDSLYHYINNTFKADIDEFKQFKDRKTGFTNLDEKMSLYPGLYVIGGLSTLGKTTFIHQMADNMAARSEHILFFSLEMSKLELITKSLSRLTVLNNEGAIVFSDGISALDIRTGNYSSYGKLKIDEAIDRYLPISKNFSIIEGSFNTDIEAIRDTTSKYIEKNDVKPVVIVDYLQIIQGPDDAWSSKDRIDIIVTELKRMSRDLNISVIVISSFNRSNYLTPVGFESFKESGGIEYSADVVWGLQLQAIHEEVFSKDKNVKDKREALERAKRETPRNVELVCLKNRNGIASYSCSFKYYSKYDYFIPMDNEVRPEAKKHRRRV